MSHSSNKLHTFYKYPFVLKVWSGHNWSGEDYDIENYPVSQVESQFVRLNVFLGED